VTNQISSFTTGSRDKPLISTVGLIHLITLLHSEAGLGVLCHGRCDLKFNIFMLLKLRTGNYGYFHVNVYYEESNK
jgi:hypothetical protein